MEIFNDKDKKWNVEFAMVLEKSLALKTEELD